MSQDQTTTTADNTEAIADITDQTLADDGPDDIPSVASSGPADPSAFGQGPTDGYGPADLRTQLAEANRRAEQEHEAYLRALADFANYKRRAEQEREGLRLAANESLLLRLLPIVDNFERALQSAQTTREYDKLVGGVSAILRQMQDFLQKEGVNPIEAVGQPFDPNYHNAVMRHETTEYPENTVVEELQKGYAVGDRVLRPSMVKVATGTE